MSQYSETNQKMNKIATTVKCPLSEGFTCLAGKCPRSCCKSWELPVDQDFLSKSRELPGAGKLLGTLGTHKNQDGNPILRTVFGRCIFWGRDHLCRLQKGEETCMPLVCRLYPRRNILYGEVLDQHLDLSCIHAASLFVEKVWDGAALGDWKRVDWDDEAGSEEILWDYPETDDFFLRPLLEKREEVRDFLESTGSSMKLWEKERILFAYIYQQHLCLVKGDIEGALQVSLEDVIGAWDQTIEDFSMDGIPIAPVFKYGGLHKLYPFYPMRLLNNLIYGEFTDTYLFFYHREADQYLSLFKKKFGNYTELTVDDGFLQMWESLEQKYPQLEHFCLEYLSYLFSEGYLQAAVDYYVLDPALFSLLCLQFLQLFLVLADMKGQVLTKERVTELVSINDCLLRHNQNFKKNAMKAIREMLF